MIADKEWTELTEQFNYTSSSRYGFYRLLRSFFITTELFLYTVTGKNGPLNKVL